MTRRARSGLKLRVLPELRSKHIDQWESLPAARVYYFAEKYDLDARRIPPGFKRVSAVPLMVRMLRRFPDGIAELPEPLWIREFPRTAALSIAWRLGALLHGERRLIVTYAIENNGPMDIVGSGPAWFRRAVLFVWRLYARALLDRIAFGTDAACSNYAVLLGRRFNWSESTVTIPMLYPACDEVDESDPRRVLFVGELSKRKGIDLLMQAWAELEADPNFDGQLLIAGRGPAGRNVARWCQRSSERRRYLDFVQNADLGTWYRSAAVLVAPSLREGRWREQVGLPVIEALSHGVRIVTTAETGIADWLEAHHHFVVPSSPTSTELAQAIRAGLESKRTRAEVRADLPATAGEVAARNWLLADRSIT